MSYPGIETNSGAHVFVHQDHAVKWARVGTPVADRIDLQARWLTEHQDLAWLPRVAKTFAGGYQMERLTALPDFVDDLRLTEVLLEHLRELWRLPSTQPFDADAHAGYVLERAARLELGSRVVDWFARLLPTIDELPRVACHGDPTWDNCMLRGCGQLVVCDPIPPGLAMPSVRALDVAKVLQSVMGYEVVACGRRDSEMHILDADVELLLEDVDSTEWQVCLYLTVVHFLRLLPYTPQHERAWKERVLKLLDWRNDL